MLVSAFKGREWLKEFLTESEQAVFERAYIKDRRISAKIKLLRDKANHLECKKNSKILQLVGKAEYRRLPQSVRDERE